MDKLVLGTASLGGVWSKVNPKESVDTILYALERGIKRIDTAPAYHNSELYLKEALNKWEGERPFISTKVGRLHSTSANEAILDYSISGMDNSLKASLDLLGKVDLLFLHEPEKVDPKNIDRVVGFLKSQKDNNTVKFIGLGGYVTKDYHPYIDSGVFDYVMNYNNVNAACIDGLRKDIPFFKKNGLKTYQGSVLHMGLLGNRFLKYQQSPPSWIPDSVIQNAKRASGFANENKMELSTFAHRFTMSLPEIDFVVLGPRNLNQLKRSLNDFTMGKIDSRLIENYIDQIL
jgi:aryl-alcohol dehydrogenase-like predicted oxidoreductase